MPQTTTNISFEEYLKLKPLSPKTIRMYNKDLPSYLQTYFAIDLYKLTTSTAAKNAFDLVKKHPFFFDFTNKIAHNAYSAGFNHYIRYLRFLEM